MSLRRWFGTVGVAAAIGGGAAPALAGGLGFGSDAPARIPIPAQEHAATVEDLAGVRLDVRRFTFNGEVFFYGVVGEVQVTVPFDRVREVRIEPAERAGHVLLFAVLEDGSTARLLVEDDLPCYGEASFGNARVEIGKVRRIVFSSA